MHLSFARKLITAEDFQRQTGREPLVPNIRTIDEAEEPEENASYLVVNCQNVFHFVFTSASPSMEIRLLLL